MIQSLLLVGAGSFAGGVCRYLLSLVIRGGGGLFPWATFVTNVAGCLVLGLIYGALAHCPGDRPQLRLLLATGFCGGFTTFSTFSAEALALLQGGHWRLFAAYAAGSLVLGLAAALCGLWIGGVAARAI